MDGKKDLLADQEENFRKLSEQNQAETEPEPEKENDLRLF